MVAILLAAAGVTPRGLQMAASIAADPHIPPGWRDRQRPDARELGQSRALADRTDVATATSDPFTDEVRS
jgi:hypothetical protein